MKQLLPLVLAGLCLLGACSSGGGISAPNENPGRSSEIGANLATSPEDEDALESNQPNTSLAGSETPDAAIVDEATEINPTTEIDNDNGTVDESTVAENSSSNDAGVIDEENPYESAISRIDLGGECEFTIDSVADWQQINNPDINVFCVAPGDYSNAGPIQIMVSGTFASRRYLKSTGSTHPVHQSPNAQAVIRQVRLFASHWTISGIVIRDSRGISFSIETGASFNTLDSLLIERSHSIGLVAWRSSHNTLQNSVMRNPVGTPGKDSYHIYVDRFADSLTVKSNELYNATGAWQQGPGSRGNHSIIDNDMYMTPERYTDCNGNLDPSGNCSCGEMYVVLKGIDDNNSVVTIEGNRMWGMRQNDPLCMSTGSPGQGINLGSGSNDTRNVFIKNNYIFDNHRDGIYLGGVVSDVLIEGNLVHGNSSGLSSGYGQNIETINNSFVGNDTNINFYGTHWGRTEGNLDAEQLPAPVCFTIKKITDPQLICLE